MYNAEIECEGSALEKYYVLVPKGKFYWDSEIDLPYDYRYITEEVTEEKFTEEFEKYYKTK